MGRISSAHVIALLALFIALGSGAYAANRVGTSQIKNNAVTTPKIKKNAVTAAKIKSGAVTGAKIGAGAVAAANLVDGAATTAKIPDGAVTSSKIGDQQVAASKLADGAVATSKLANGSVTPAKMTEYTNSGLVKLQAGTEKVLLTRGPFTFTAHCADAGGGVFTASMTVKNNGADAGLMESHYLANYASPAFAAGAEQQAFYPANSAGPYWFGEFYNLFSVTSADGSTALDGHGSIGVHVLGADCAVQLFTQGA